MNLYFHLNLKVIINMGFIYVIQNYKTFKTFHMDIYLNLPVFRNKFL